MWVLLLWSEPGGSGQHGWVVRECEKIERDGGKEEDKSLLIVSVQRQFVSVRVEEGRAGMIRRSDYVLQPFSARGRAMHIS